MNDYEQQAKDFCEKYNVTISPTYTGHRKYFPDDKEPKMKQFKHRATPPSVDYATMMQDFTPEDLPDYAPVRMPILDDEEACDNCLAGMCLNFD